MHASKRNHKKDIWSKSVNGFSVRKGPTGLYVYYQVGNTWGYHYLFEEQGHAFASLTDLTRAPTDHPTRPINGKSRVKRLTAFVDYISKESAFCGGWLLYKANVLDHV